MRLPAVLARLILGLTVSATACDSPTSPLKDYVRASARWSRHEPVAYSMNVSISCECAQGVGPPVTVVVRNGVVDSRTYVHSGQPVPSQISGAYPNVDGLFEILGEGIRSGETRISAQFDDDYGYPIRFVVGDAATDAPVYSVKDFRRL